MTIRYCDFCGEVIQEGTGDPITLADVESIPEARKDACEACSSILWKFTRDKNLKSVAACLGLPVPPASGSALREGWYWVWYESAAYWIIGEWDGEDWNLANGITTTRRHVIPGPRIMDHD